MQSTRSMWPRFIVVAIALAVAAGASARQAGAATVTVASANLALSSAPVNTFVNMLSLQVTTTQAVTLTQMQIQSIGTVGPTSLGLKVLQGNSNVTGSLAYNAVTKIWTVTFGPALAISASNSITLTVQENVSAAGASNQLSVPSANSLVFSPTSTVYGTFPVSSNFTTFAAASLSPAVTVTGASLAPTSAPVNTFVPMLSLTFSATKAVTLTQMKIQDIGTVGSTSVALSGPQGASSVTAFVPSTKTWTLSFSPALSIAANGSVTVILQEEVTTAGATGQLSLPGASSLVFSPASTIYGTFPIISNATTFAAVSPAVTVTSANLAPTSAPLNTFVPMLSLTLASTQPVTLTQMQVKSTGTAGPTSVALKVLLGTTNVTGSPTFASATKTWTVNFSPALSIAASSSITLTLEVEVSASGATAQLSVPSASSLVFSSTSAISGTFPVSSGLTTFTAGLSPIVAVTGTSLSPISASINTFVSMLSLTFASTQAVTLTQMKIQDIGTVGSTSVALKVFEGSTNVTGSPTFATATKTWTVNFSPGLSIAANSSITLTLQEEGSAPGTTGQLTLPSATSLVFNPASTVSGTIAVSSGATTFTAGATLGNLGMILSIPLSGPAPAGGATVSLTSSNSAVASVPSTVTIPAGSSVATVPVTTGTVTADTTVVITATYLNVSKTIKVVVSPQ